MIRSELLKESIADAKAVRATALANAKAFLEEAFSPRFEAMFADKLKEEAEEEQEESVDEVAAPNQVSKAGGQAKGPATKDVSKGEPKKVSDAASNFKTVAVGGSEGARGSKVPAATQSVVKETAEEEEEGTKCDESAEEQDETVAEAGLTSEDLDEIIRELEAEVSDEEGGEPVDPTAPVPAAGPAPSPDGGPEDTEGDPEGEPVGEPEEDPAATDVDVEVPAGGEVDVKPAAPVAAPAVPGEEGDEEINLDELLAALNEEAEEEEEEGEKVDESTDGMPKTNQESKATVKGYPKTGPEKTTPGSLQVTGKNHNVQGKGNIGSGAVGGLSEEAQYKEALDESYKAIEYLRAQINEVNLLNAKLLYTNKLFKEFAGMLDDPYRMKIVEAFDLTKNVREVKLAYALLAESLSFGAKIGRAAQSVKKSSPAKQTTVKQITEGLASKPVGSTKPSKEIISEGANEMANRFKKLAGIKTPVEPKK